MTRPAIGYGRDYTADGVPGSWDDDPYGSNGRHPDGEDGEVSDSWAPIDLGPYLRGEVERPEPNVGMVRSDGLRMLYPGKEHSVIGEMESGKSWYCLTCAAAELAAGHHVVYIHFEEGDPSDTVERLLALGVPHSDIVDRFRFVAPERQVTADALHMLLDPTPSLVILDGITEAMSLHRDPTHDGDGAASFRRRLVKPCTRTGAATLSADHVPKDPDKRGRSAIGSVHKGNGLTGSLIMLENAEPFGRSQRGRSHVFITKDRPGYLRRHGKPTKTPQKTYMGELVVDDSQTRSPDFTVKFWAPKADLDGQPTDESSTLTATVLAVITALPDQTATSERHLFAEMRKAGHKARNTNVQDAIDDLLAAGQVSTIRGSRGAKGYRTTASQDHEPNASE